jgi:hypothetical protein
MVWEMGHALASELGEGPSVRESFIDTPERVLVPPDFSRGTCESCIPVILEKAPMGMVAKSQFKEANPGRPQGAGSRLCGPASQLSKVCQSVCDHYEQYASADIYADESVSSHISYRRGEGYLRSHGTQGITLACFALVHPDAYSAGKAEALAGGESGQPVSIPMPGLTKDEVQDAQDVLDNHDGWVPEGLNWAAKNGHAGKQDDDKPRPPASKEPKTVGQKVAETNTKTDESDDDRR